MNPSNSKGRNGPHLPTRQKQLLAARLRAAVANQPELATLRRVLLAIGGTELVAPPGDRDRDVPRLLAEGRVMTGPITFVEMQTSRCHANVARLWEQRYPGMIAVCTGYALSDDGLWRQHSWGLLRDGILETTVSREVYFGVICAPALSDPFAQAKSDPASIDP